MIRSRRLRFSLLACVLAVASSGCSSCGRTSDAEDLANKENSADPPPNDRTRHAPPGMPQAMPLRRVQLPALADGAPGGNTASPIRALNQQPQQLPQDQ